MALDSAGLVDDLEAMFGSASINPATLAGQWAALFSQYATGIVPASTTVVAASAALQATLAGIFGSTGSASSKASAMESAFDTWAAAIGLGMTGFTPTPPSGNIGFLAEMSKPSNEWAETYPDAAVLWGGMFHAWMTTGFSTLIVLPNTVVPWS